MDYITLKYIITVDKYQSISKAAEELYLSQPNISKAIQNIEKEVGFQIFSRTSRGATTTPEGKEFIKNLKTQYNLEIEPIWMIQNGNKIEVKASSSLKNELKLDKGNYLNKYITTIEFIEINNN